jgi:anti-sigma B factor antagonist
VGRSSGAAPPLRPVGSHRAKLPVLTVRIEDSAEGTTTVALAGELDLSTITRMERALQEQVTQRPAVLVDLSSLAFIDSSGIGILIQTLKNGNGTPMHILIRPGSQVDRVFRIAGLYEALPVFSDRERALTELAEARNARPG